MTTRPFLVVCSRVEVAEPQQTDQPDTQFVVGRILENRNVPVAT